MADWYEIKEKVETKGNVLTVTMFELRNATGKDKLGVHVLTEIRKNLEDVGLGHIPQELPSNQGEPVRLYKRDTLVGEIIDMVLSPSEQNDRKLREQFSESAVDYARIIEQIRDLVSG